LERYFASLMPLAKTIRPFRQRPKLKPFSEEEFLMTVTKERRFITSKEWKEKELYRRFLASPNFWGWFSERSMEAVQQLSQIYDDVIYNANVAEILKGKSNIEAVDIYMQLNEKLRSTAQSDIKMRSQLQNHMQVIVDVLPLDLQSSVLQANQSDLSYTPSDSPGSISNLANGI